MRVPTAFAAVSVATSAVLLLSACGGSDSTTSDKIAGVPTGSPSASAAPTTTIVAGRPVVTFPADAKDVFEGQHTGDPVKDAVLADNAHWVESMDDAIFQGTTKTKALGFYGSGKGLESSLAFVQGALSKGFTWTGEVRFFHRKAAILDDGSASVIYCSDESKEFLKHRKTGKIDNTPTTADSYVLYNTHLKKNQQGVWQTDNVGSVRGAKQCQP
ncbi:hypothetical protein [Streptomyces sp. RKAG293]|uniref:hypothetical protein n=1 Tax=Streptomyces sp. RKAG293 TaxID=2893403 RepID=UPI002033D8B2|nr:hypothetical protein [Streptomyces sp. RKAG293]MCM2419069.1 hypothetical protein [Streptomyces sp. RKAG293]